MNELTKYSTLFLLCLCVFACSSKTDDSKISNTTKAISAKKDVCQTIKANTVEQFEYHNNSYYVLRDLRNKKGVISSLTPSSKKWRNLPGSNFNSFAISPNGNISAIKRNKKNKSFAYNLIKNKWVKTPGDKFEEILYDNKGKLYAVKSTKTASRLYASEGTKWKPIPKSDNLTNVTVFNGDVYGLKMSKDSKSKSLIKLSENKLSTITKKNIVDFSINDTNFCLIELINNKKTIKCLRDNRWKRIKSTTGHKLTVTANNYYSLEERKNGNKFIKNCIF